MTKGTTLGADDGAGVAIMLGLLLDKKDDSSIEALFTVEEETTLGGANAALPGKFKSKYLINIDNIDDTDIVIGSASTSDYTITLPITRKANKDKTYSLKVFGGTSGHSGGDIHKTISNVAIDTCSILFDLAKKYQFNIININSGMAKNSIPSSIEIIFTLKDSIEQFKNEFTLLFEEYKKPYHVFEKNLTFELKTTKSSSKPFDSKSSKKLLDLIVASTNGMNRYDHDLNLTIASNNLGMIKTSEKDVNLSFLNRSSFSFFDKYLRNKVETLANLAGAKFTPNQYSVGAPAYIDNPLAKVVAKIAKTKFKHQTKILAIHAGLEFGLISRNYPGMNYISVGPNIKGEHTVNEMMEIKSFEYVYKLIKETIKELN
jgi:dipeptidase D